MKSNTTREVKVLVTVEVDSENVNPNETATHFKWRVNESVRDAISNAVTTAEEDGFSHKMKDEIKIRVVNSEIHNG